MRFKINCASLQLEGNSLFLLCFTLYSRAILPLGTYIQRGNLTEGFLRYKFGGLIFGGSYTWRGLFLEFSVYELVMSSVMMTTDSSWHRWY